MNLPVRATPVNGVVVISCFSSAKIRFVGASCTASVKPGICNLDSVTLSPVNGQKAIVALTAEHNRQTIGGILELYWEDGKLFVDSNKDFVSPADRLGQVLTGSEDLLVSTHDQVFGTCRDPWEGKRAESYEPKKVGFLEKGIRIVDDANLLCRYLVGQVTFDELEAVASGDLRTVEEMRDGMLATAKADATALRFIAEQQQNTIRLHEQGFATMREDRNGLKAELEQAQNELSILREERNNLQTKLGRTFGVRFHKTREGICARFRKLRKAIPA